MRRFILFMILCIGLVTFVITPAAYAQSLNTSSMANFFDTQFNEKMEEHQIPNAVISVVADGKVIFEKGYGYANWEKQIPVDPKTSLFRIGSTSKLFTWTAVMQLVEQGKLDLNADINTYLDFSIPDQLAIVKDISKPAPITLTHLMTHTAGFEDYSDSIFRLDAVDVVPLEHYIHNNLPARIFPPNEIIAYSNYGTALAGYIVQQVSGLPFSKYVEEHIFRPLQMSSSSFLQPLPAELSPHMTQAYRYVNGEFRKGSFEFVPDAAGGMSTSAADMAQFMLAHLQGDQVGQSPILTEETLEQMRHQQFTHHPSLQGIAYGFMEGTFNDRKTLFHSGSTMLYDTGLYLLPEEKIGIFISYSGGNYLVHKQIFQAFLDQYYPAPEAMTSLSPPEGTMERSSPYVGEYHQNRKSFTTSEKFTSLLMGIIHVQWDDEGYLLVKHLGDTYRFVEVEPGIYHSLNEVESKDPFGDFSTIVFSKDPIGNIVLLTDGPMSYSKAPWYSTSSFTFLALVLVLLFIIGSLVYKGILRLVRLIRRQTSAQPHLAVVMRWTATIYSLLMVVMVVGTVLTSEFDPVYLLPKVSYGVVSAWDLMLEMLPLIMTIVGAVLLLFTVLAWQKNYWRIVSRVHYTLFTVAALMLSWLFYNWNLI